MADETARETEKVNPVINANATKFNVTASSYLK